MDTYTLGEIHLHAEDTDVLGTGGSLDILAGGSVEGDGHVCWLGRRGEGAGKILV